MKYLILGLVCLFGAHRGAAQCPDTLRLLVLDAQESTPLADVALHLHYPDGTDNGLFTDAAGQVAIPLCKLPFNIHIDILGYQSQDISITKKQARLTLQLVPEGTTLDEVVVNDTRTQRQAGSQNSTIDGQALQRAQGGTLADALKLLPGVSSLNTGATISKPMLQGMSGTRVLILNNGVRQEAQQWGNEHAPEIDPFLATSLTVVRGAASVRYGTDAIGGVVLVEPPSLPNGVALAGAVNLVGNTNGRGGALSGTLQGGIKGASGLGWRVQGTYRRMGDLKAPDYYLDNTGLREANFSAAVGLRRKTWGVEGFYSQFNTQLGILSAAHIGNLSDLGRILLNGRPFQTGGFDYSIDRPYQDVTHQLFKTKAYHQVAGLGLLQLTYSYQRNERAEYDLVRRIRDDQPQLEFTIKTHNLELALEAGKIQLAGGSLQSTFGLVGFSQNNTWSGRFLVPFFDRYGLGGFAIEQWRSGNWELAAGIRYEYQSLTPKFNSGVGVTEVQYNFNNLVGNLGATHNGPKGWTWEASIGHTVRPPVVNELFSNGVHHGSGYFEQGDSQLISEQSYKATLSVRFDKHPAESWLGKNLEISALVFINQVNDYINLVAQGEPVLTIRGAFPAFRYVQSDVLFYGGDFTAKLALTPKLTYRLMASWVRTEDAATGYAAPFTATDRYVQSLTYRFKPSKTGTLKGAFIEVNNMTLARAFGLAPSNGLLQGTPQFVAATRDYAVAPPGYNLLGFVVGATWRTGQHTAIEASFSAQNVLNTSYRDYTDRFRYFAEAPGSNFRFQVRIPIGYLSNPS